MKSADNKEQNYQFKTKVNMKTKTSILALTKAFFILLVSCCLFSCNNATDENKCLENIRKVYPNSKIYKDPEKVFSFYVVDSTGMRKVTTLNLSNADIDGITEFVPVK